MESERAAAENSWETAAPSDKRMSELFHLPGPPNVPPLRALWSLFVGIWGILKGSWGVLVHSPVRKVSKGCQS